MEVALLAAVEAATLTASKVAELTVVEAVGLATQ
jgi:hypothetical protein